MAVLPAADIILPRARAGGGVSLSCPALAGEERQALSFSRKVRAHAEQRRHERNDRHERLASKQEGRRSAEKRANQEPHRKGCGARPLSCPPTAGGPRPKTSSRLHRALDLKKWSGRARLSAPHRGIRGFGLGSAWAALPGTTGCKREDPLRHQCSEHLAVRHAPDGTMPKPPVSTVYRRAQREPPPLRLKEYPRERRPFASGILGR
jgi:hypothetical protein